eukprot:1263592-Pleurochrysis_carterae.AAC.1
MGGPRSRARRRARRWWAAAGPCVAPCACSSPLSPPATSPCSASRVRAAYSPAESAQVACARTPVACALNMEMGAHAAGEQGNFRQGEGTLWWGGPWRIQFALSAGQ